MRSVSFAILLIAVTLSLAACAGDAPGVEDQADTGDAVLEMDTAGPDALADATEPDLVERDADDTEDAPDPADFDDTSEVDVEDLADAGDTVADDTRVAVDTMMPPADPCARQDQAPKDPGARKAINDDPAFIQVYNNNIENLKTANEQCRGDWTDLIYYMKSVKPVPDLFLVQQISDQAQLGTLVDRMTRELPGEFAGIIADADPWPQGSPCGPEKRLQTNAIIFRKGRFSRKGDKHVWQSWAFRNGECRRNGQARTRNVMARLHDKIANKDVTVVSFHWSTAQGTGPDPACAEKNVRELDRKLHLDGYEADLLIFGGDANERDRNNNNGFTGWYKTVNGDRNAAELNYRDAIFYKCDQTDTLHKCLDDNWTIGNGNRIDFLMSQTGEGCRTRMRRMHTVTFNEADAAARDITGGDSALNYSDHRAIRAELYY